MTHRYFMTPLYYDSPIQRPWTLTPRRLRPIRVGNKTQTRDPLNFGPCKADWPAAFVIKYQDQETLMIPNNWWYMKIDY